jgi:alpha-tubulin suppressor-like RCC1 family protein
MKTRLFPWLCAGAAAALIAGCEGELTEILVVVDSDLAVPGEIDAVRIEVMSGPAAPAQTSTGILGVPRMPSLPRTLALVHKGGPLGPIEVRAQVLQGPTVVVERRARVSFVQGEVRVLRLNLDRDCEGMMCGAGMTCAAGVCRSIDVPASELPPWTGSIPSRDGGMIIPTDGCPGVAEVCNGMDDDCDGVVDNGIDLDSDPSNCGRCAMRCAVRSGATATCTDGMCGYDCMADFDDCDTRPENGCEASLVAPETCGSCTNDCTMMPGGTFACEASACRLTGCMPGFGDCDADASTGCEQMLDTVAHCGMCGMACTLANATEQCTGGTCEVMSCDAGFDDCDGDDANGCETPLDTLSDCGSCGTGCDLPGATDTCATGTCAVASCMAGLGNCDMDDTNGCETPTTTVANCGTCGTVCSLAGATETCATGMCRIMACDIGFDDCDSMEPNGCETDLRSDDANCGMCGMACAGGRSCAGATCVVAGAAVQVTTGQAHSCALLGGGTVECWGSNVNGQLGDGSMTDRTVPTAVPLITDAVQISAGSQHTCAVRASGQVACWGSNASGQLGDGTTMRRLAPVMVGGGLADAIQVSAGGLHTCALRATGAVVCWGENSEDQLGDGTGTDRNAPVAVIGITDAIDVSAGGQHSCAVRSGGGVLCWGRGNDGALGDGAMMDRDMPVAVMMIADGLDVAAGTAHTCLARRGGAVSCWGSNSDGQLGGIGGGRSTPATVAGIPDAQEISAGGNHTCARRATGGVACWGRGSEGQIGDGTTMMRTAPTAVTGIMNATSVSAGGNHSCATRATGSVSCWGANASAQLGDGSRTQRNSPVTATGIP